jgi:hypothetical protein
LPEGQYITGFNILIFSAKILTNLIKTAKIALLGSEKPRQLKKWKQLTANLI